MTDTGNIGTRKIVTASLGCARFSPGQSSALVSPSRSLHLNMAEVTEVEPSKLEKIKKYFTDRGLTTRDIPTAFVVHEIFSVTFAVSTWVGCYYLQPGRSAARPLGRMLGKSKSKAVQKTYLSSVSKAKKIVAKVPFVEKSNATRLTTSCAESVMFRLIVKPITVPGKLWATWKIMTAWKRPSTQMLKP